MNTRDMMNIMRNLNSENPKSNYTTTNKSTISESSKCDVRNSLNKIRRLNEATEATQNDQRNEESRIEDYFSDLNVNFDFQPLEIYPNGVYFGFGIDNVIQAVYKVTEDQKTSGFDINYLPDFDKSNPDNDIIIKRIETYFDIFYKYWRDNIFTN